MTVENGDSTTTALSIAGYDPSGGAGVLNDIKTFHALGVYGTAVITALTVQNTARVENILPISTEFIKQQIDVIMDGEEIVYAKTGMLYSPEIVKTVSRKIKEYKLQVVVDPVMVAGSGGFLKVKGLAESLKKYLLPQALLTTPNIFEAQALTGIDIKDEKDAIKAALNLGKLCNVVITGGHLNGNDVLYDGSLKVLQGKLIDSENTHGSGCTYSAATTAYLLKNLALEESLIHAGEFTRNSIKNGAKGTLNQFWNLNCKINKNYKLLGQIKLNNQ